MNLLLEEVVNKTVILTTRQHNKSVKSLYRTTNLTVIKEPFLLNGVAGKLLVIIEKDLDNNI